MQTTVITKMKSPVEPPKATNAELVAASIRHLRIAMIYTSQTGQNYLDNALDLLAQVEFGQ